MSISISLEELIRSKLTTEAPVGRVIRADMGRCGDACTGGCSSGCSGGVRG